MLIIVLLKAVPARTTQAVQMRGVLNREAMDLVLNPHDSKAVEAADFLKRRVGGKVVALSMGPDMKLIPLMKPLFDAEVLGVDEEYILSDRRMAGSDTLATSYAVSLGVKKLVERHVRPIEEVAEAVRRSGYSEAVKAKALELYRANLLPNRVFSELPAVRDSIVERFLSGAITADTALSQLEAEKARASRFVVVAGIKTTDGETGSVGPQVAEGVSELLGQVVPHATYVDDFDLEPGGGALTTGRMIGNLSQKLEMQLPALMTVSTDYRPRPAPAANQSEVRANDYIGKQFQAFRWTADDLGADPKRLGLMGSPTIVGTGVDVGKPPVQKALGRSLVFKADVPAFEFEGTKLGPFSRGDLADQLSAPVRGKLQADGAIVTFGYDSLVGELFA